MVTNFRYFSILRFQSFLYGAAEHRSACWLVLPLLQWLPDDGTLVPKHAVDMCHKMITECI
jgi:hypothetical protein